MPWVPLVTAAASLYSASKQRKAAKRESARAREDRAKQRAILEKQKQEYRDIEFTNPYADMENQYAGMENPYAENVYEDLTVNQQQAKFQTQQGAQQRANIMGQLRGAAGSSGIAGLAQSLANQGQLQTQQISASIGQQEARNQKLAAQGAQQKQRGAAAVDLQQRQGEEMVQEAESGRQATLLGVEMEMAGGANKTYQQQLINQASANVSADQMQMDGLNSLSNVEWDKLIG